MLKDSAYKVIAVKTIIKSIVGLCAMPLLGVVMQYIDSVTGFSAGQGYHTDSSVYIFEKPLVYLFAILCICIIGAVFYLVSSCIREKRGA